MAQQTNRTIKPVSNRGLFLLIQQAQQDGAGVGKVHRTLGAANALEGDNIIDLARNKGEDAWIRVRKRVPDLFSEWSGNLPLFLVAYQTAFLAGYLAQTRPQVTLTEVSTAEELRQIRERQALRQIAPPVLASPLITVKTMEEAVAEAKQAHVAPTSVLPFTVGVHPALDPKLSPAVAGGPVMRGTRKQVTEKQVQQDLAPRRTGPPSSAELMLAAGKPLKSKRMVAQSSKPAKAATARAAKANNVTLVRTKTTRVPLPAKIAV